VSGSLARAGRCLRRAFRERRLVLLLWAVHLVLAALALAPIHDYLYRSLAFAPEGDRLLGDFDMPLLLDLGRGAGKAFTWEPVAVLLAVGLLWSPLAAGGILEVLRFPGQRPVAVRFGRGAGRYFGRFLRMGIAGAVSAFAVAAIVSAPVWIVRGAFGEADEAPRFYLSLAGLVVALAGWTLALLALDRARAELVRTESPHAVRLLLRNLGRTLRRPLPLLSFWLALALPLAAVIVLLGAAGDAVRPDSATLFALVVLTQQLAVLARLFQRVALWAGVVEIEAGARS
jgi:hypothetical protein